MDLEKSKGILHSDKYEMFKFLPYNRDVCNDHVTKLKNIIQLIGYDYSQPISVDSEFNIIDGQHRYTALKNLGLPIPYVISMHKGEGHVVAINNSSKKWEMKDYLKLYLYRGLPEYLRFKKFMEALELPMLTALTIYVGVWSGSNSHRFNKGILKGRNDEIIRKEALIVKKIYKLFTPNNGLLRAIITIIYGYNIACEKLLKLVEKNVWLIREMNDLKGKKSNLCLSHLLKVLDPVYNKTRNN